MNAHPEPRPSSVVDAQLAAYNRHDPSGFASCYAEDAVVRDADGAVRARGREAVEQVYAALFTEHAGLQARVVSRTAAASWVVDEELVTRDGETGPLTTRAVVVYRVRHGLIRDVLLLPGPEALP